MKKSCGLLKIRMEKGPEQAQGTILHWPFVVNKLNVTDYELSITNWNLLNSELKICSMQIPR